MISVIVNMYQNIHSFLFIERRRHILLSNLSFNILRVHYREPTSVTMNIIPGAAIVVISYLVEKIAILLLQAASTQHHKQHLTS